MSLAEARDAAGLMVGTGAAAAAGLMVGTGAAAAAGLMVGVHDVRVFLPRTVCALATTCNYVTMI